MFLYHRVNVSRFRKHLYAVTNYWWPTSKKIDIWCLYIYIYNIHIQIWYNTYGLRLAFNFPGLSLQKEVDRKPWRLQIFGVVHHCTLPLKMIVAKWFRPVKTKETARDETCVYEMVVKDGVGIEISSNTWVCAFRYFLFSTSTVEIDPIGRSSFCKWVGTTTT